VLVFLAQRVEEKKKKEGLYLEPRVAFRMEDGGGIQVREAFSGSQKYYSTNLERLGPWSRLEGSVVAT
jgi:hypothetical protein